MDIITHSQGGSCAVTQTECCALIVDESASISSHLLNHTRTQVNTLSDPTPGLVDLNQWSDHGALDREKVTYWGIIVLIYFLLHAPILFLWHLLLV